MKICVDSIFCKMGSNESKKNTSCYELKLGEINEAFIGLGKVVVEKVENDKVYLSTRLNQKENMIVLSHDHSFTYSPTTVDVSVTYIFSLK
ncbi:MAG: hypothetical protein PHP83_04110 [Clostridia bacterium]|nr:hypothetical protein [Clostridia bacterium]